MTSGMQGTAAYARPDRESAVGAWLLTAADNPDESALEWQGAGRMTQLRCGVLFTAISVPGKLVRAAAGAVKPEQVDAFLAEALHGGPVIYNRTDHYYALTPPDVARRWQTPPDAYVRYGGRRLCCLGDDRYLGVPALSESDPSTAFIAYWSVPVAAPGKLSDPITVVRAFNVGDYLCGGAST